MENLFTLIQNHTNPVPIKMLTLENAYTLIKGNLNTKYEQTVTQMRAIDGKDYETRKKLRIPLKDTLPAIIFNAVCNGRIKTENVTKTTGYIIMDIDGLSDDRATSNQMACDLRENIFNNPRLGVVFAFVSPSGEGVKALVRVPKVTVSNYEEWQSCVAYFINHEYQGIKCDDNAKNITRLCYLSVDPDAKLSTDPNKVFAYTLDEWQRCLERDTHSTDSKAKQTSVFNTTTLANSEKGKYKQFMREYANLCGKNSIPVFCDYNSWIALGGYIYEIFDGDDEGLRVWEAISSHAPNYNPDDFKSNWKFQATPRHDGFALMGLIVNQTKPHLPSIASWVSLQRNKLMIHD